MKMKNLLLVFFLYFSKAVNSPEADAISRIMKYETYERGCLLMREALNTSVFHRLQKLIQNHELFIHIAATALREQQANHELELQSEVQKIEQEKNELKSSNNYLNQTLLEKHNKELDDLRISFSAHENKLLNDIEQSNQKVLDLGKELEENINDKREIMREAIKKYIELNNDFSNVLKEKKEKEAQIKKLEEDLKYAKGPWPKINATLSVVSILVTIYYLYYRYKKSDTQESLIQK